MHKIGRSSWIQGTGLEDKKRKWLNHFATLLGQPPSTALNKKIRQLFEELDIETGPTTREKLQREGMKSCDFDDIILELKPGDGERSCPGSVTSSQYHRKEISLTQQLERHLTDVTSSKVSQQNDSQSDPT